jgi:hypothetical protein
MDTLQLLALIIVALIILAVIIAFRRKIALILEGWGFRINVSAENADPRPEEKEASQPPSPSAGVSLTDVESTGGGLLVEAGRSETGGPGIEADRVKTKKDIIIGTGESLPPKDQPPA